MTRSMIFFLLLGLLGTVPAPGQGGKRPDDTSTAKGNVLGQKPSAVVKVDKFKGVVVAVDLKKRTVSLTEKKEDEPLVLEFSQPQGREQIKVSNKAAKALGKKKIALEELKVGTEVRATYYPFLGQILELIVED